MRNRPAGRRRSPAIETLRVADAAATNRRENPRPGPVLAFRVDGASRIADGAPRRLAAGWNLPLAVGRAPPFLPPTLSLSPHWYISSFSLLASHLPAIHPSLHSLSPGTFLPNRFSLSPFGPNTFFLSFLPAAWLSQSNGWALKTIRLRL